MTEDPGLFRTIYTSRALRRFRPDPVPEDVLFQVLDAAIRAPSGQNAQDWRFIVITEPGVKRRLQAWAVQAWPRYQPELAEHPERIDELPRHRRLPLKAVAHLVAHLAEVPVIVAVCGVRGRHVNPGGSSFPAIQNMLLAARGLGLGGSIFNFPLIGGAELYALLDIPADHEISSLVVLGHPSDRPGPVWRKPVKSVAFWNRWGRTWDFAERQPDDGWGERWAQSEDDGSRPGPRTSRNRHG